MTSNEGFTGPDPFRDRLADHAHERYLDAQANGLPEHVVVSSEPITDEMIATLENFAAEDGELAYVEEAAEHEALHEYALALVKATGYERQLVACAPNEVNETIKAQALAGDWVLDSWAPTLDGSNIMLMLWRPGYPDDGGPGAPEPGPDGGLAVGWPEPSPLSTAGQSPTVAVQ